MNFDNNNLKNARTFSIVLLLVPIIVASLKSTEENKAKNIQEKIERAPSSVQANKRFHFKRNMSWPNHATSQRWLFFPSSLSKCQILFYTRFLSGKGLNNLVTSPLCVPVISVEIAEKGALTKLQLSQW